MNGPKINLAHAYSNWLSLDLRGFFSTLTECHLRWQRGSGMSEICERDQINEKIHEQSKNGKSQIVTDD
jgi:hypothetical protein